MLYKDLPAAIGNTPLILLKKASALTGCNIYGKGRIYEPWPIGERPRRAGNYP